MAGPGVYICDGCVVLSNQLIAGKTGAAPQLAPWEAESGLQAVLASLPRIALAASQADHTLRMYVGKARESGATWAAVGDALGITRQSAWERFSSGD